MLFMKAKHIIAIEYRGENYVRYKAWMVVKQQKVGNETRK